MVKGFLERLGVDFNDTFIQAVKLSTVGMMMVVVEHHGFRVYQLNAETAFLHGVLKGDLSMEVSQCGRAEPGSVLKLQRSLYGLKQAMRCRNESFNATLLKLELHRSIATTVSTCETLKTTKFIWLSTWINSS